MFGLYISLIIFSAILTQLVFGMGLMDLFNFLVNFNQVLLWGLIPFVIFWIVYIILYFYKSTEEALRWQFGGTGK
jgi:NADH:ubiquinone oxidoreductase subunit 3 (subunit A)